jgi:hypothetical protein
MPRAKKDGHERGRYRLDPKLYVKIAEAAAANDMSLREYTKHALAASLGRCPTCGRPRGAETGIEAAASAKASHRPTKETRKRQTRTSAYKLDATE